jgi:hypothetical protein
VIRLSRMLFPFLGLCACSVHHVHLEDPESMKKLNKIAPCCMVKVKAASGKEYSAEYLAAGFVKTRFYNEETKDWQTIPTKDIVEIKVKRRGLGIVYGLVGGLAFGLLSASLGYLSGDDPPCDDIFFCFRSSAKDKALIAGSLTGFLGLILGPLLGGLIGFEVTFILHQPSEKMVISGGGTFLPGNP